MYNTNPLSYKENLQPLDNASRGESNAFHNALKQPLSFDQQKQKFEEEIRERGNTSDPIDSWDRYLNWMIKNAPDGLLNPLTQELLHNFLSTFSKSSRYKCDPRLVNAWLISCDNADEPLQLFNYMIHNNIGVTCASFYVAWAAKYESSDDIEQATKIYQEAVEKNAQPLEYLKQQKLAFENRQVKPTQSIAPSRHACTSSIDKPITQSESKTTQQHKTFHPHEVQANYNLSSLNQQPQKKLPYELQEEAMLRNLNGAPLNEPGKRRMYDVDKVYGTIGEMEFQQIRAAWWRKRQQMKEPTTEQMMLKIQELEAELQNMKLHKRENVETSKFYQDEEDLTVQIQGMKNQMRKSLSSSFSSSGQPTQDENAGGVAGGGMGTFSNQAIANIPVQNENAFEIFNDNEDVRLKKPLKTVGRLSVELSSSHLDLSQKGASSIIDLHPVQASSGNISNTLSNNSLLNFSKRSQPSPTLHTKEALAFFQPCMQASLRGEDEESQLHDELPGVRYNDPLPPMAPQNNDFSIFNDDDDSDAIVGNCELIKMNASRQNNFEIFHESNIAAGNHNRDETNVAQLDSTSHTQTTNTRSTSAFHPARPSCENVIKPVLGSLPQTSNALRPVASFNGDKSLFLDDMTVAGRHFAAEAHLASTPFYGSKPHHGDGAEMWSDDISQICFAATNENKQPVVDESAKPGQNSLSTIMEASHETNSTKSSTKSRSESEGDKTNKSTFNQPTANHNLPDFFLPTPVAKQPTPTTAIEGYEDFYDLLDQPNKVPNQENENFFGFLGTAPSSNAVNRDKSAVNRDKSLSMLSSDSGQTGSTTFTLQNTSLNIVSNPWDDQFIESVLAKTRWRELPLIHMKDCHTRLNKNHVLQYGEKLFKMDQLIGEGNFAKVHKISPINGRLKEKYVIKVQKPACPMEIYALCEAKKRLEERGLCSLSQKIINIHRAYLLSNASILLLPYFENGTLLDYLTSESITERMVLSILLEIMEIVHGLHEVSIIHGDIKPDNFLIQQKHRNAVALNLIDFGRAIDMRLVPNNTVFTARCNTSGFECIQMLEGEPWNYHIDYFGIAGILYVMLTKSYIKLEQKQDGKWSVQSNYFKRLFQSSKDYWLRIIECLLNHETPQQGKLSAPSPLPGLISELRTHNSKTDL